MSEVTPAKPMTFYGLSRWYGRAFKKFGWMILALNRGDYEKLEYYERSVQKLSQSLRRKKSETQDADQRADLQIMYDNVAILLNHLESMRLQQDFETFVEDLPFSVSEEEE